jgi:hypothetical protein
MARSTLSKASGGPRNATWPDVVPPVVRQDLHALPDTAAPAAKGPGQSTEARETARETHLSLTEAKFDFTGLGTAGSHTGATHGTAGPAARAEHSNSFVWLDVNYTDHPAMQNSALTEALERAREKVTDLFHVDDLPSDPIIIDGDAAGGRSSGGGGGGKGRTKTPTEPVVDSGTTPTTTPTTTTTTTSPVKADYTSGLDTPNGFNIGLVFTGTGWTDSLKLGFQQAAEFFSDIIKGDLASVSTSAGVIDDIRISVSLTTIDGSGGFAGWGGYTAARSGSALPYDGYVKMDSADTATLVSMGIWNDFALHEMLHALGFGTAWSAMGLVKDYGGDLRFIGTNATRMYNTEYPLIAGPDPLSDYGVPVETDGGSGTAGVHWDETTFQNEIMTGMLNYTNTVSDMTIAALQDMGYQTIYIDQYALG